MWDGNKNEYLGGDIWTPPNAGLMSRPAGVYIAGLLHVPQLI